LNWLYTRRHLGTVRDGAWRDLAYVVECDNLEKAIRDTLDLIRRRDGVRVANEVRDRLADGLAVSIGVDR
jgi:hypothetical protein